LLGKAIEQYISLRTAGHLDIEQRLLSVVERVFKLAGKDDPKQTIGLALEAMRLDLVEATIQGNTELIKYTLESSLNLIDNYEYKKQVLFSTKELFYRLFP
jgi:hypothetical protein